MSKELYRRTMSKNEVEGASRKKLGRCKEKERKPEPGGRERVDIPYANDEDCARETDYDGVFRWEENQMRGSDGGSDGAEGREREKT